MQFKTPSIIALLDNDLKNQGYEIKLVNNTLLLFLHGQPLRMAYSGFTPRKIKQLNINLTNTFRNAKIYIENKPTKYKTDKSGNAAIQSNFEINSVFSISIQNNEKTKTLQLIFNFDSDMKIACSEKDDFSCKIIEY
ncbi:MAG: hypothetical protein K2X50_01835 [Gammaproteobacteria bacterium]|nr:hypothetical protein [Gammaproteobacteria bacterium]